MILPGLDRDGGRGRFHALDQHLNHLRGSWYGRSTGSTGEALAGLAIGAMSLRDADVAGPALIALAEEADAMGVDTLRKAARPKPCLRRWRWSGQKRSRPRPGWTRPGIAPGHFRKSRRSCGRCAMPMAHCPAFMAVAGGLPGGWIAVCEASDGAALPSHGLAMGYARMARAHTTLILDAAAPPGGPASVRAHASTLGFELTIAAPAAGRELRPRRRVRPALGQGQSRHALSFGAVSGRAVSARLNPNRQEGEPDILTERPELVWAGDYDALGNLTTRYRPGAFARNAHLCRAMTAGWSAMA